MTRKFSLEKLLSEDEDVVNFDLQKEFEKKEKKIGGANERSSLLRSQLQAYQLILRKLKELETQIQELKK